MSILGGDAPREEAQSALEVGLGLFNEGALEFRASKPGLEGVRHQRASVGSPRQGPLCLSLKATLGITIHWRPLEMRNHEIIFNYQTHHQVLLGKG